MPIAPKDLETITADETSTPEINENQAYEFQGLILGQESVGKTTLFNSLNEYNDAQKSENSQTAVLNKSWVAQSKYQIDFSLEIKEAEDSSDTAEQIESYAEQIERSAIILYCFDLTKAQQTDYLNLVEANLNIITTTNPDALIWIVGTKKDLTPSINQQLIQTFMGKLTQNKQNIVDTMVLTAAKEHDVKALTDSIFNMVKKKIREELFPFPAQQGINNPVDATVDHDVADSRETDNDDANSTSMEPSNPGLSLELTLEQPKTSSFYGNPIVSFFSSTAVGLTTMGGQAVQTLVERATTGVTTINDAFQRRIENLLTPGSTHSGEEATPDSRSHTYNDDIQAGSADNDSSANQETIYQGWVSPSYALTTILSNPEANIPQYKMGNPYLSSEQYNNIRAHIVQLAKEYNSSWYPHKERKTNKIKVLTDLLYKTNEGWQSQYLRGQVSRITSIKDLLYQVERNNNDISDDLRAGKHSMRTKILLNNMNLEFDIQLIHRDPESYLPKRSDQNPVNDDLYLDIKRHIVQLAREYSSFWPYPHKERKLHKAAVLFEILEKTNNENNSHAIQAVLETIQNRYRTDDESWLYSAVTNSGSRTAVLINQLKRVADPQANSHSHSGSHTHF